MATARNVGTAGWNFFINFAHRLKVHNNMFLGYTKFNALSYVTDLVLDPWGLHQLPFSAKVRCLKAASIETF